jgi:hypothetical protein
MRRRGRHPAGPSQSGAPGTSRRRAAGDRPAATTLLSSCSASTPRGSCSLYAGTPPHLVACLFCADEPTITRAAPRSVVPCTLASELGKKVVVGCCPAPSGGRGRGAGDDATGSCRRCRWRFAPLRAVAGRGGGRARPSCRSRSAPRIPAPPRLPPDATPCSTLTQLKGTLRSAMHPSTAHDGHCYRWSWCCPTPPPPGRGRFHWRAGHRRHGCFPYRCSHCRGALRDEARRRAPPSSHSPSPPSFRSTEHSGATGGRYAAAAAFRARRVSAQSRIIGFAPATASDRRAGPPRARPKVQDSGEGGEANVA